ncbi:MAG: ATP-binding protein [Campylobacterota bacterium]|nr:ATP-binding protein [Campylobacterota bacterium]
MIDLFKTLLTKTIKRQLVFGVSFTIAIIMSVFIFYFINIQKTFLHQQSLEQATSLTQTLSKNATSWVLSNDFIGMEEIIESVSSYPNLKYAMLLTKDGKVLSHTNKEYINRYVSDKKSRKLFKNNTPQVQIIVNNNSVVDISVKIQRGTQHIGWARIALSKDIINNELNDLTTKGFIYTILVILLSIVFSYIMGTGLTKSLYELIEITTKRTKGDTNLRAYVNRGDEIGMLSNQINKMFERIEDEKQKTNEAHQALEEDLDELERMDEELTNLNNSLESKVNKKTQQLKEINEHLQDEIEEQVEANRQKDNMVFQQSKMAAMGEMIGNIAHQWRQPISVIAMWANNMKIDIELEQVDNKNFIRYADSIVMQTQHLSQTIDDFKNFFTPAKEKNFFTISNSMDRALKLVGASFKTHNIQVITDIEDIEIKSYENELTQAILNILNNAKDVLLQLKEENRYIFISVFKKERSVIIEIKDSGGGVEDSIISRIFEPYFTTKHKAQGTGIGLYMTESIIVKHLHGQITVKNSNYTYNNSDFKGAVFKISIPI